MENNREPENPFIIKKRPKSKTDKPTKIYTASDFDHLSVNPDEQTAQSAQSNPDVIKTSNPIADSIAQNNTPFSIQPEQFRDKMSVVPSEEKPYLDFGGVISKYEKDPLKRLLNSQKQIQSLYNEAPTIFTEKEKVKQVVKDKEKALIKAAEEKIVTDQEDAWQKEHGDGYWSGVGLGVKFGAAKLAKGAVTGVRGLLESGDIIRRAIGGAPMTEDENKKYYDAWGSIDKSANLGLDKEYHGSNALMRAVGGLAEFAIPAALSESTGGASFLANGIGNADREVRALKQEGHKFENHADDAYVIGKGIAEMVFMKSLTAHSIFPTLPSGLRNVATKEASINALKGLVDSGAPVTSESLAQAFKNSAIAVADQVKQKGLPFLKTLANNYKNTSYDLVALTAIDHGLKKVINEVSGEENFDTNPDNLYQGIKTILTEDAPIFAAYGSIGQAGMLLKKSPIKNAVIEQLKTNSSPESVEILKRDIAEHAANNGWKPEEVEATKTKIEQLAQIVTGLPKEFTEKQFSEALELIEGKENLENQALSIIESKISQDPSLAKIETPEEVIVKAKLQQGNDKMREVVDNGKFDYIEKDGKFFKKFGEEESIEISKDRYDLEELEASFRPGPEITPNKEVKANQKLATTEVTNSLGLKESEGQALYSGFKGKRLFTEEDNAASEVPAETYVELNDVPPILKKTYERLEEDGLIESFDGKYYLTEKGGSFKDAVNTRLATRKGIKSGTDIFPLEAKLSAAEEAKIAEKLNNRESSYPAVKENNIPKDPKLVAERKTLLDDHQKEFGEDLQTTGLYDKFVNKEEFDTNEQKIFNDLETKHTEKYGNRIREIDQELSEQTLTQPETVSNVSTKEDNAPLPESTVHETQARVKAKTPERIKPEVTPQPTVGGKKLNHILKDFTDGLDASLIYAKPEGKNSAGTYNPSNALIKIKNAGDLDTAIHEVGHLLDDRFNLLGNKPAGNVIKGRIKDSIDKELKWYADRGGSNPPQSMDPAGKRKYLQHEGLAEFIRAYVANPKEAKKVSPELFDYFEKTIDDKTKTELAKFSKDYIEFSNSTAGEQVMANIEELETKSPGIKDWLQSFSKDKDGFHISPFDKVKAQVVNSMGIANKAFEYVMENKSITNVLPEKNFETISRLFAGVNGKITRVLDSGLVDAKNEYMLSSDGKKMNLKWLFDALDTTTENTVKAEMDEVIKYLVAERTIEYSVKFQRSHDLTGVGARIKNDLDVAELHLADIRTLEKVDPEKHARIVESAKRYREYADAGLRYAVQKGRLSQDKYDAIKDDNQYYVSLARVKEVSPTEEPLEFINKFATGGLTSTKDVLKTAKGGTGTIQNPYLSLIKNTTDIIRESDRNEVMASFVEPLSEIRQMGNGTPGDFGKIARKVAPGERNAKSIYVKGEKQTWQFADDIYEALIGMGGIAPNAFVNVLAIPGSILRWTVTHFPVFAAKNIVRDTMSRTILSRSGSGIKDLIHDIQDKELFELYGGSQAGYYLINKTAYAKQLKNTISEIAESGKGFVLDPRNIAKGWDWYENALSKGENVNRIAEFKSAFKKAKDQGMDDYNAGLQAAFEARDTLDFAVAGHAMKVINRLIPFSNAGVQGLRRSALAIKEDPAGFATRIAMYSILPQLAVRSLVHAMGDDEEYEQLPAYMRDLTYSFRTPFTGDKWISIPKPFDLGIPSSIVDRMISKVNGNYYAFKGSGKSMLNVLVPFDEGSVMGPFKPIVESFMNKDTFRDSPIIPHWEEKRLLKNREGAKNASTISKQLSQAMGLVGAETDPRYIDHFIKGQFSYFGDWTLSLSDAVTGNEKSRNKMTISKTGFVKDPPIANAQAVKDVYEIASKLGLERAAAVTRLSGMIKAYYSTDNEDVQRKQAEDIYNEAIKLRTYYESKLRAVRDK